MASSLGKGLQALIPKKTVYKKTVRSRAGSGRRTGAVLALEKKESVFSVEVDKIRPNPNQPRQDMPDGSLKELANSIREHGVLQPLIVTKIEKTTDRGQNVEYEIVAGERRWRASKIAGLRQVPVIIRDTSMDQKLQIALVENIQRENLNPIDLGVAFRRLIADFGLTQEEVASKVGKSRPVVGNYMRLLSLPVRIKQALSGGEITDGHGRALLIAREDQRMPLFRRVIKHGYSVRQTEDAAKQVQGERAKGAGPKNVLYRQIESDLKQTLGRLISITQRGEVGSLRIEFRGKEDLDKLTGHLLKFK